MTLFEGIVEILLRDEKKLAAIPIENLDADLQGIKELAIFCCRNTQITRISETQRSNQGG